MDLIQGRVLLGILMELKKEGTPRVVLQQETVLLVPLGNADQGRICVTDVVRWDTSFETTTGPKGMVLVYLEGNNGRTWNKCNY